MHAPRWSSHSIETPDGAVKFLSTAGCVYAERDESRARHYITQAAMQIVDDYMGWSRVRISAPRLGQTRELARWCGPGVRHCGLHVLCRRRDPRYRTIEASRVQW